MYVCMYVYSKGRLQGLLGSGPGSGPKPGSGPGPSVAAAPRRGAAPSSGPGLDLDPGPGPEIFQLSGRPRYSVPDKFS